MTKTTEDHWDALLPPGPNDDAKHLVKLNHIQVAGDRSCRSFRGMGGIKTNNDRFVVVEAGKLWTIGGGGLRAEAGSDANFVVKLENGLDDQNRTRVTGGGATKEIDFIPGDKQRGSYIDITSAFILIDSTIALSNNVTFSNTVAGGGIRDTSIAVGNDAVFDILGAVTGPGDHTVGCSFGNRGNITVAGDISGVDMAFGTSSAQSEADRTFVTLETVGIPNDIADDWTLRGYASVDANSCLFACIEDFAGQGANYVLQNHVEMTIGRCLHDWVEYCDGGTGGFPEGDTLQTSVVGGTWIVKDSASLEAEGVVLRGYWTVQDAADVDISARLAPDALTVDGAFVTCASLGHSSLNSDIAIRNGGNLNVDFTSIHPGTREGLDVNSTLVYDGAGNRYTAGGIVTLGGSLAKEGGTQT